MRVGILLGLLSMLLFSACSMGGSIEADTNESHQEGIRELTYAFHPDAPPKEILSRSRDEAIVILENQGAASIEHGVITLITDGDYVRPLGKEKTRFTLEGRNKFNPDGSVETIRFPIETGPLDRQSQRHEEEIMANVCYDYATELNDIICIDPDPYSDPAVAADKVCTTKDITSSGQGAPVVIERVGVKMLNQDNMVMPVFTIEIENRGKGIVVQQNHISDLCSGLPLRPEDMNKISVYATLGDQVLDCDARTLQLIQRKTSVRCYDPVGINAYLGAHETPIHIRLTYGYSDTIVKRFAIVR